MNQQEQIHNNIQDQNLEQEFNAIDNQNQDNNSKQIKIYKRKVRGTQKKRHQTETDSNHLVNQPKVNTEENKQGIQLNNINNNIHDQQLQTSTEESNHASSQRKEYREQIGGHQKILSLRSFKNKIIPLYQEVEDIIPNSELVSSPKKSLSSYSILQTKIIPNKVLQKNLSSVSKEKENFQNKIHQDDNANKIMNNIQRKQHGLSEEPKKIEQQLQQKQYNNNLIQQNMQQQNQQFQNDNINKDYIFFREEKSQQQQQQQQSYNENVLINSEKTQGLIRCRISSFPHQFPQRNALKQFRIQHHNNNNNNNNYNNNIHQEESEQNKFIQSEESLTNQRRISRIESKLLKEKRLSMLQDYKGVDFKCITTTATTSSSSSSSNSSLLTIKKHGQQQQLNLIKSDRNHEFPINYLYNISPEKKSMKNITKKKVEWPQTNSKNIIQKSNDEIQHDFTSPHYNHPDSSEDSSNHHKTKSHHKNDIFLKFFLSSQKQLIKNVNTNKSHSTNTSKDTKKQQMTQNNTSNVPQNNAQVYDYPIRN